MEEDNEKIVLTISENHNLLYINLPTELIKKLEISYNDVLEYDLRGKQFYCRKKGIIAKPNDTDNHLFEGLKVERSVTKNNTILRTNLPKEVSQPLDIAKGDNVELTIEGNIIIGTKLTKK